MITVTMLETEAARERHGWTEWRVQGPQNAATVVYHHGGDWSVVALDGRLVDGSLSGEPDHEAWRRLLEVARRYAARVSSAKASPAR